MVAWMHRGFYLSLFLIGKLAFGSTQTILLEKEFLAGKLKTEIHFEDADRFYADRVADIIRNDLASVVNYFQYVPKDVVHFNIVSKFHVTNGNARTFPTDIINLYPYPANNGEHLTIMEDGWKGVVLHEFTHILHLDQTRGGVETLRKVFGTIAKAPPAIAPRWFIEGIAVWSESHFLNKGRLQSDSLKRELATYYKKEGACQTIDCLDNPGEYPGGQLAYWAGAYLLEQVYLFDHQAIKCLVEFNSSSAPFRLNKAFLACTGKKAEEWQADVVATLSALVFQDIVHPLFGSPVEQSGVIQNAQELYRVERNKTSERLVRYDLEDQVAVMKEFSHPLADVSDLFRVIDSETKEEGHQLLVSFNDDPTFRSHNKSWSLLNAETLAEEKSDLFPKREVVYAKAMPEGKFLIVTFENNRWEISVTGEKGPHVLLPKHYGVLGLARKADNLILKYFDHSAQKSEEMILKNDLAGNFKEDEEVQKNSPELLSTYPALHHFIPHYWFLSYGSNSDLSYLGFMTELSDPLSEHTLRLDLHRYFSIEKNAGLLSYAADLDPYYFNLSFDRSYSSTVAYSQWVSVNDSFLGVFGKKYYLKRWLTKLGMIGGYDISDDLFFSNRMSHMGGTFSLIYGANSYDDTLQLFQVDLKVENEWPQNAKNYPTMLLKILKSMRLTSDVVMESRVNFGRFFKSDFKRGVLYGGGENSSFANAEFDYYGLSFGNAYGNTMATGRIKLDYKAASFNSGSGLFPLFAKEFHLIGGAESLKSDKIYFQERLHTQSSLYSYFLGTTLQTIFAYWVPVDISLTYSKLNMSKTNSQNTWSLLIQNQVTW